MILGGVVQKKRKRPEKSNLLKDNLVYVEWEDAFGVTQEWTDISELEKKKTCICASVGYLIEGIEQKGHIIVVPHLSADLDNSSIGCGEMIIPKTQIRVMRKLNMGNNIKI